MPRERAGERLPPVEHAAVVLRTTEPAAHPHRARDWAVAAVVGVAGGAVVGLGITAATTGAVLPGGAPPALEVTRVEAGLGAEGELDRTVTVPADALAGLVPGDRRTFTLDVTNDADSARVLRHSVSWEPSPGVPPFVTDPDVELVGAPATLPAGGTVRMTVVVTAPQDWGVENQGTGASLVLELRAGPS